MCFLSVKECICSAARYILSATECIFSAAGCIFSAAECIFSSEECSISSAKSIISAVEYTLITLVGILCVANIVPSAEKCNQVRRGQTIVRHRGSKENHRFNQVLEDVFGNDVE